MHTFEILKDRPISVCPIELSRFVTRLQELPLTFGNRKSVVFGSPGNVVDVIAAVTIMLYFL